MSGKNIEESLDKAEEYIARSIKSKKDEIYKHLYLGIIMTEKKLALKKESVNINELISELNKASTNKIQDPRAFVYLIAGYVLADDLEKAKKTAAIAETKVTEKYKMFPDEQKYWLQKIKQFTSLIKT
jgi:hypothetical protein